MGESVAYHRVHDSLVTSLHHVKNYQLDFSINSQTHNYSLFRLLLYASRLLTLNTKTYLIIWAMKAAVATNNQVNSLVDNFSHEQTKLEHLGIDVEMFNFRCYFRAFCK